MSEEYIYQADAGEGRLKRQLFYIRSSWSSLKTIVERELENALRRLQVGITNDKDADRLYQDVKVIFENVGRLSTQIKESSNRMLNGIHAFKQGLGRSKEGVN